MHIHSPFLLLLSRECTLANLAYASYFLGLTMYAGWRIHRYCRHMNRRLSTIDGQKARDEMRSHVHDFIKHKFENFISNLKRGHRQARACKLEDGAKWVVFGSKTLLTNVIKGFRWSIHGPLHSTRATEAAFVDCSRWRSNERGMVS